MTNGQLCPRYGRVSDFLRNDRAKAGFNPTHGGRATRNPFSHFRGVVFPAAREEEERNGRRKEKEEEEETVPFSEARGSFSR